jgi:hypothetical protein
MSDAEMPRLLLPSARVAQSISDLMQKNFEFRLPERRLVNDQIDVRSLVKEYLPEPESQPSREILLLQANLHLSEIPIRMHRSLSRLEKLRRRKEKMTGVFDVFSEVIDEFSVHVYACSVRIESCATIVNRQFEDQSSKVLLRLKGAFSRRNANFMKHRHHWEKAQGELHPIAKEINNASLLIMSMYSQKEYDYAQQLISELWGNYKKDIQNCMQWTIQDTNNCLEETWRVSRLSLKGLAS